jgi:hypothetical protein
MRICIQSLELMLIREKKFFLQKFNMGIKTRRISHIFQIHWKIKKITKKVISKNVMEYALFLLLLMFVKLVLLITFWVHFLKSFSTYLKSAWNSTTKIRKCKCVLDLNFASVNGSVFFIFFRKSKSVYPYCAYSTSIGVPITTINFQNSP